MASYRSIIAEFTVALVVVAVSRTPALGAPPRCVAAKLQAVGLAANGMGACEASAAIRGMPVKLGCTAKVDALLARAWSREERNGTCPAQPDAATAHDRLHAYDTSMRSLLASASPPSRCTAGKLRHAGQLGLCHLACSARAVKGRVSVDHSAIVACNARCRSRFARSFDRDEARSDCHTRDDATSVDAAVTAFTDCVADLFAVDGAPPCGDPTTTTVVPGTSTTSTVAPGSTTSTTTSSTTTLLACGGVFPICAGSCPPGETCTGAQLLDPCVCVASTTSSTTSSSTSSTSSTSTPSTSTSTTTTTLLACGGVFPACIGDCPPGQTCTGSLLNPCTCQ